jgi:hypothetical protein
VLVTISKCSGRSLDLNLASDQWAQECDRLLDGGHELRLTAWHDVAGVSPLSLFNAYIAAIVAFLIFAVPASLQQERHSPMVKHGRRGVRIDWTRVFIVAAMLFAAFFRSSSVGGRASFPSPLRQALCDLDPRSQRHAYSSHFTLDDFVGLSGWITASASFSHSAAISR